MHLLVIYVHLSLAPVVFGARVLLLSVQFNSHQQEQYVVGRELISQGHEVHTIIQDNYPSSYMDRLKNDGFKLIISHLPEGEEPFVGKTWNTLMKQIVFESSIDAMQGAREITIRSCARDCHLMLGNQTVMASLKQFAFDLALVDGFVLTPCLQLIPHLLNVPFISMTSVQLPNKPGIPFLPSTEPIISSNLPRQMDFMQRIQNSINYFKMVITDSRFGFDSSQNFASFAHHASDVYSWMELTRKACIFVQTRDHLLETFLPSMPNFIQIPGITLHPAKRIPESFQKIIDQTNQGMIIFTMGSSIAEFPQNIFARFITVFGQLKQTIIMRYTGDVSSIDIPQNVHIRSWLPQNDLLAQKKTKLFITHGGNNGQYESIYHGVPLLSFPVFADQFSNAERIEMRNLGKYLPLATFTEEELKSAINELLTNPVYKTNAEHLSAILKDRPLLPAEEVAYWMNHVMKFGCGHLRSHAADMPWYTLYMIDVIAVIVTVLVMCGFVLYLIVNKLLISFVGRRKSKKD